MATRPLRGIRLILGEARTALGMTQREFGDATQASHRTAVRWDAGQSTPGDHQLRALARLVHPVSRPLASELADHVGETLESLGLEAPPLPPPPLRDEDLVDVVVLAAIEATGSTPAAVRPWLHAVFKRARDVGLTTEAAERALRPAAPAEAAPAEGERARRKPVGSGG